MVERKRLSLMDFQFLTISGLVKGVTDMKSSFRVGLLSSAKHLSGKIPELKLFEIFSPLIKRISVFVSLSIRF